jgi:hypothetical protein
MQMMRLATHGDFSFRSCASVEARCTMCTSGISSGALFCASTISARFAQVVPTR